MTAEEILNTSELLIKSDCVIIDGVLYEHCKADTLFPQECYRYFITADDYDYLDSSFRPEDAAKIEMLDKHFKK